MKGNFKKSAIMHSSATLHLRKSVIISRGKFPLDPIYTLTLEDLKKKSHEHEEGESIRPSPSTFDRIQPINMMFDTYNAENSRLRIVGTVASVRLVLICRL